MNALSWKKTAVAAVALLVTIAGIFYFITSTGKKGPSLFVNPAFAEYINSYTTGVIPSASVLNIVFPNDMVDSSQVNQGGDQKLFEFKPSLKGKTIWLDKRTVEFRPENRMTAGQVYHVKFFLSSLINDLPEDLQTFEYSFQVVPQNFEMTIVNIRPYNKTELKREVIEGNLNTADFAEAENVEKTLTAFQDGQKLRLAWTHAEDGKLHAFTVEEVARKEQAGSVEIRVNGI